MQNSGGGAVKNLLLKGRRELCVEGVKEVESFDENGAVLQTVDGELVVEGREIRLCDLDAAGEQVRITGRIDALMYSQDTTEKKKGLRSRLFG